MKTDNELLADFIGLTWHDNGTISSYPTVFNMRMGEDTVKDLKFDTSWDWLMPVVEKISKLESENIDLFNKPVGEVAKEASLQYSNVTLLFLTAGIDKVYRSVVEFIKWYNSQPKP